MIALLLQAAPLTVEQEISAHPYVAALIISIMTVLLLGAVKLLASRMEGRINEKFDEQARLNATQDQRLDEIESDLRRYDNHVAVGAQETEAIHASIRRVEEALANHVEREETVTWRKIDDLVDAINTMRLSNAQEHGGLVSGQAVLATRLDAVEKKMPNGELKKLADAFATLAEAAGGKSTRKR